MPPADWLAQAAPHKTKTVGLNAADNLPKATTRDIRPDSGPEGRPERV
jgi:hypothetical protein